MSFLAVMQKGSGFLLINLITTIFCFTSFFLKSATMKVADVAFNGAHVEPEYGNGLALYAIYFLFSGIGLIVAFKRDLQQLRGSQKSELAFVVLGATVALSVGTTLSLSIPLIAGTSQFVPFSNALSIITLVSTIGYGIATQRILGILTIIRRIFAYTLLCLYLVVLYLCVWFALFFISERLSISSLLPAHVVATLVVAFSMAPVHGRLQKVADKLIPSKLIDIPGTIKMAGDIFQSVTTLDALCSQFSVLLIKALGAEHVRMLSATGKNFRLSYELGSHYETMELMQETPLIKLIKTSKEPVSRDSLIRVRETPQSVASLQIMLEYDISVATGVFSKGDLSGIVLLGAKNDGRIYDKTEQDALQILCNQLAVALENARLYTEMQDSKIRNEIMLDQLVSGVIVASPERKIALFNHEAQRITDIDEHGAIGESIDVLPRPIIHALDATLEKQVGVRNVDATLFTQDSEEESASIRMGSAFLFGHDSKPVGALLVFTDMTELKSLEEQVRRSDQLSSVGTLAAGMAHEIKNPLVTIKTFTQLLPKRYADEDFREDFASLVAHEVERIDSIVNELLSFSKPAKPHLIPMNLHETVEQTLKLMSEQLSQKNIALKNTCRAGKAAILGDARLLSQALVNLVLNAIEAIDDGGHITVGSINCMHLFATGAKPGNPIAKNCIRLQVSDTGAGIAQESLQKIFDPFFTSKSDGTGMGLSVSHGIIREHHGVIEVESEPEKGSTFYIYIPLLEEGGAIA